MQAETQVHHDTAIDPAVASFRLRGNKFKRKKDDGLWLMSFSDMSMILISFFILQLSFSTMNQQKLDVLREAIQSAKFTAKQDSLTAVHNRIETEIKRLKLDKSASVNLDSNGVIVEFKDGLLFSTGSADTNSQFAGVVSQMMKVIANSPKHYTLRVEGHTDDVPIKSTKFASNWELSAARAISLMRMFSARGVDEGRLSVEAFAHTKPKRGTTGLEGKDLEQARASNRRVVIRIEAANNPS
jgi:chemotaxis protein MotB